MRWGLIVRSEIDRGLGIQTHAMYHNLKPDKTLLIINERSGFAQHPERYPDAQTIVMTHESPDCLDELICRDFLRGLDAIVTVETFYDWRFIQWAEEANVATIIHGNPEFFSENNPLPTAWWKPTGWRSAFLPDGPLVPVPVPDDTPIRALSADQGAHMRALFTLGSGAMADRNGSGLILRGVPDHVKMTVYSQVPIANPTRFTRCEIRGPVFDRWEMYNDQHVLVLARRFGGLCLPVLEAMASGLAVVMPDCEPNREWPVVPIPGGEYGKVLSMPCGEVPSFVVPAVEVTNVLKRLANDRHELAHYQNLSRKWADENRWAVLKQRYYDEIHEAIRSRR